MTNPAVAAGHGVQASQLGPELTHPLFRQRIDISVVFSTIAHKHNVIAECNHTASSDVQVQEAARVMKKADSSSNCSHIRNLQPAAYYASALLVVTCRETHYLD